MVGTQDYIAPEIVDQEVPTTSADLWSFGIILYMMLFNLSPFQGKSYYDTLLNIKAGRFSIPADAQVSPLAVDLLH